MAPEFPHLHAVQTDRRALLKHGLLGGIWLATASLSFAQARAAQPSLTILERLCDLVIPETDTPGALSAGVPAFLVLALQNGVAGADRQFDYAHWCFDVLGADFMSVEGVAQIERLTSLDQRAFDRRLAGPDTRPWTVLKTLIVWGYYTSEIGGSVELRYEHQPGRWVPDLPLKPGDRALSNDWTAVEFG